MCKNGKECDMHTKIRREAIYKRTTEEIDCRKLRTIIQLPKILGERRQ